MKKNLKKLRLNRETLVLLESTVVAGPRGAAAAIVTSCTYPCDCQTGCTEDQPCMGTTATATIA
ncbi:MAG TPA: hypothetical protein VLX28_12940 [Thermoanaerobaculia bacterium]|nr:hypothetical protein [Thermoanaerobaculia bacterium]